MAIVYLHIVLPAELRGDLPVITQSWGNFSNSTLGDNDKGVASIDWNALAKTRNSKFGQFLDSINTSERPSLHFYRSDNEVHFSVILSGSEFVDGENTFELYAIHARDPLDITLEPIGNTRSSYYHYVSSTNAMGQSISDDKNKLASLNSTRIRGFVDSIDISQDIVEVKGWAADVEDLKPADFILLDIEGELTYLGRLNLQRMDLVRSYESSTIRVSGYVFKIPRSRFGDRDPHGLKIIAVGGSEASTLKFSSRIVNGNSLSQENPVKQKNLQYQYSSSDELPNGFITDTNSTIFPMTSGPVRGYVDKLIGRDDYIEIGEWAANIAASKPADFILLQINDALIYLGSPSLERQDVSMAFDNSLIINSGYSFRLLKSRFLIKDLSSARLIGVSDNTATELQTSFSMVEQIALSLRGEIN